MILKLRVTSLIAIHILILLHVYYFGSDVVGSIDFQEFFHSFIKLGVINAGVILVFLAFLRMLNVSIPHKSFDEINSDVLLLIDQDRKLINVGIN